MWIFKTGLQDFFKIYFPSILGLIIIFISKAEDTHVLFYFLIFHLVDVGHVYSTMMRTLFDKHELKREYKTLLVPCIVGLISFAWLYFKIPYYWSFVVYFTVFHNLRQGWGIIRWYEKLNNSYHNNELFYYCFTIVPFVIFHLRDVKLNLIYYSQTDSINLDFLKFSFSLEIFEQSFIFNNVVLILLSFIYICSLLIWLGKEFYFYLSTNKMEYNRIISMVYFIFVYAYSFLYATSSMQIFTILILSHGIPYLFIMEKFLNKKNVKYSRLSFIVLIVCGSLLNLGLEDFYLESIFNYSVAEISFLEYFLTLVYISPILSHFIWDMYLWKREHPDSALIY